MYKMKISYLLKSLIKYIVYKINTQLFQTKQNLKFKNITLHIILTRFKYFFFNKK